MRFDGLIEAPPRGAASAARVGARLRQAGPRTRCAPLGRAGHRRAGRADGPTGLCTRRTPSGIALRGYVRNPAVAGQPARRWTWSGTAALRPGYGWISPLRQAPGTSAWAPSSAAARAAATQACARQPAPDVRRLHPAVPPARRLMAAAAAGRPGRRRCAARTARGPRAAPASSHWRGARLRPTTSPGEGIGKALETGLLAADTLRQAAGTGAGQAAIRQCCRLPGAWRRCSPKLRALRARQPGQPPPLAGRSGDLARPPQPAAAHSAARSTRPPTRAI